MIPPARRSPTGRWMLVAALALLTACAARGSALAPQTPIPPPATVTATDGAHPTGAAGTPIVVSAPATGGAAESVATGPVVPTTSVTASPTTALAGSEGAPVAIAGDPSVTSVTSPPAPEVRSGANVNAAADAGIGDPISISIPSIGVESLLVPTGVLPDGTMAVPADASIAGWFTGGPKPGQRGPAVIMGHLDQRRTGPGVFWHLRDLQIGADVTIHTTTGDVVFVAEESELIGKDQFPTERVYGSVPTPALRLITCGGTFDRKIGHYRSNVVVYLVPEATS